MLARVAASLRRRADQVEPHFSTTQIIDKCFPRTTVTGRMLRGGIDEAVRIDRNWRNGLGHRREHVIVYNRNLPADEQRFAIAHALGHVIFDGAAHAGCYAYDDEREQRCDRFAELLLVPLEELRPYVCAWPSHDQARHEEYLDMVDMIASHFRAPVRVIDKRIRELARRDPRHFIF